MYFFLSISFFLFFSCSASSVNEKEISAPTWTISTSPMVKKKIVFAEKRNLSIQSNQNIDSIYWINEQGEVIEKIYAFDSLSLFTHQLGLCNFTAKFFSKAVIKKIAFKYEVFSDILPEELGYKILKKYPHLPENFTQGLEFVQDTLYESTGLYGQSKLFMYVLPRTDKPILTQKLEDKIFGEGLTYRNGQIFQITWKNQEGIIYEAKSLKVKSKFSYFGEGWGLVHNKKNHFILSNGSEKLQFLNDQNLKKEKEISVYSNIEEIDLLNELEFIPQEDVIWANRYMMDIIYIIDEKTGRVISFIDFSALRNQLPNTNKEAAELNGIAYHRKKDTFFITGKLWSHFFEVKIINN